MSEGVELDGNEEFLRSEKNAQPNVHQRKTVKEEMIEEFDRMVDKFKRNERRSHNLDIIQEIIRKTEEKFMDKIIDYLISSEITMKIKRIEEIQIDVTQQMSKQFNKPILFDCRSVNLLFIGRTEEMNVIDVAHGDNKSVVITGDKGVGKSEVAKKYSEKYKHEKKGNILWMQSDTDEILLTSFKDLGILIDRDLKGLTNITIIDKIIEHFNRKPTLMIFDNCSVDNFIIRILKSFSINPKFIKILITSSDSNWTDYEIITLEKFTKKESVTYIETSLKELQNTIPITDENCETLSTILDCSPKALIKATDYIIEQNLLYGKEKYTIEDYIECFTKKHLMKEDSTKNDSFDDKNDSNHPENTNEIKNRNDDNSCDRGSCDCASNHGCNDDICCDSFDDITTDDTSINLINHKYKISSRDDKRKLSRPCRTLRKMSIDDRKDHVWYKFKMQLDKLYKTIQEVDDPKA